MRHNVNNLGSIWPASHTDACHLVLEGDNRAFESEAELLNRNWCIGHQRTPMA